MGFRFGFGFRVDCGIGFRVWGFKSRKGSASKFWSTLNRLTLLKFMNKICLIVTVLTLGDRIRGTLGDRDPLNKVPV